MGFIVCIAGVLTLSGCQTASAPKRKVEFERPSATVFLQYREFYLKDRPGLDPRLKRSILEGHVAMGMTKAEVTQALNFNRDDENYPGLTQSWSYRVRHVPRTRTRTETLEQWDVSRSRGVISFIKLQFDRQGRLVSWRK